MVLLQTNSLAPLVHRLRSDDLQLLSYLKDCEAHFNTTEPLVHAFLPEERRFKRIRRETENLLKRYPKTEIRPPLFGVPIGVKDIFHVTGFETHAGSKLPPSQMKGNEAECVSTLKNAGALIMGKTVTTEFAYFAPGPTRNPHNPQHTPGGSSSGSAAAVAARLCPLTLGTQTIGSIIRPASFCGVVGYKPSYDRISRAGVIQFSPSLDHVGFFVSDVKGANLVASVLCRDWRSETSTKKPVLGIPEGPYMRHASEEGLEHFNFTCQRLIHSGFEVRSIDAMPDFDKICSRHNLIMAAEVAQVHIKWYAQFNKLYHPITSKIIKRGQQISKASLQEALPGREKLRMELMQLMDENKIDLWISPAATGPAPRGLDSTGDPVMNLPWTHSGLPTINLPVSFSQNGLPMGLQIIARWYADELLLSWVIDIDRSIKSSA